MVDRKNPLSEDFMATNEVCKFLGFQVSVQYLNDIGAKPAIKTNTGAYWRREDLGWIAKAIVADLINRFS